MSQLIRSWLWGCWWLSRYWGCRLAGLVATWYNSNCGARSSKCPTRTSPSIQDYMIESSFKLSRMRHSHFSYPWGHHSKLSGSASVVSHSTTWHDWRHRRYAHWPWGTFMPVLQYIDKAWWLNRCHEHHIFSLSMCHNWAHTFSHRVHRDAIHSPLGLQRPRLSPP